MDKIGERLRNARESLGYAQKSMAEAVGSKLRSWQDYEAGNKTPGSQVIAGLSALGVDANWVLTGRGEMMQRSVQTVLEATANTMLDADTYAMVPFYDVQASAGHGALVGAVEVKDWLVFRRDWLERELHASESDLYLIEVDGESMEPTLRPGDTILVDHRSQGQITRDGIYVLRMDGTLLVKRLQRLPGRLVRVSSDNPAYQPFELSLDNDTDDLAIVGRVVWTGRRM